MTGAVARPGATTGSRSPSPGRRDELLALVERRLDDLLDRELTRWARLDARAAVPVESLARAVRAGGKRLRPTFVLTGYLAAGGPEAGGADVDAVVDAAAAVELLHVGALVHDDVLDDAELRRGVPPPHVDHRERHAGARWRGESRRYGEGVAILVGDLATAYAEQLVAGVPPAARRVWGEMLVELQIGQYLDMAVAAEGVARPRLSRKIAVCKSGRYSIHRPLSLGARAARGTGWSRAFAAFEIYGHALGEAFQLRDDLIDLYGDAEVTGKPAGLDLAEHKMTLLLAESATRDPAVADLIAHDEWDVTALRERLLDGADVIERRIADLVARATRALEGTDLDTTWRRELTALAQRVAHRDR